MRSYIKNVLRFLGIKKISFLARRTRSVLYWSVDIIGYVLFYPFVCQKPLDSTRIKKILIIRIDRIGDMVLSTSALRAVRETFPDAVIHVLAQEYTKDLIVANPNINKIVLFKKDTIATDYDLALAIHPGLRENYIAFISGAKWRAGYTGWGGGFFLTHKIRDDRSTRVRHEVESTLEIAGLVGCTTKNTDLEVSLTDSGEHFADGFVKQHIGPDARMLIAVHPGSRQSYIRWTKEGFAETADRLIEEYHAAVVLIGSTSEKGLGADVASLMKGKPVIATDLSLTQLVSLIKRCSLFIGNSTGPMHIAAALKVPVVAIFGATNALDSPGEWGPWKVKSAIVSKNLSCKDCHPTDCKTFDCMNLLTVDDVMEGVRKCLA